MKTKYVKQTVALVLGLSALASPLLADVGVQVTIPTPAPPVVVTPAAPSVEVTVPDNYVWDGTEYVGTVGSGYYYLGPNDVWLPMDAPRLTRWHSWEHDHADWRTHAIRNERYRHDARGHDVPRHDEHHEDHH